MDTSWNTRNFIPIRKKKSLFTVRAVILGTGTEYNAHYPSSEIPENPTKA